MDSTSKVKIEYTDPSDIFSAFAKELYPRLPLKELHWSSSSRPIRSISNLHVEFVSDENPNSFAEPSSTQDSHDNQDHGIASKGEILKKGRRHQIPGLRRTPYLKIYLLLCSDVDIYRGSQRKQLRDWIKDNTAPSQSNVALNKQDNHDAHEWLIIHVIPSPAAALSDPSRPPSSKADGIAEKRPSSSRWPSRNPTSVIEKLRADFNGTSKNAIDRVAQVHLCKSSPEEGSQDDRRTHDKGNGWDDLISKLKSLILASFDSRVSQYEEDIREREGQKTVVGWNFNTFFVLKEGLAMGFENMGLIEDALTMYQELAFGLNSVLDEQQMQGPDQQTTHFIENTEDLYETFRQAQIRGKSTNTAGLSISERMVDPGIFILNTNRKPFRDLILGNKISVFDFQCYVFARQSVLSLRLANSSKGQAYLERVAIPRHETGQEGESLREAADLSKPSDHEPENLLLLAEIVKSAAQFITSMTPIIRGDIQSAVGQSEARYHEDQSAIELTDYKTIEKFVLSWLFSASQCVLEVTSASSLTAQINPLLRQLTPNTLGPEASTEYDQDANQRDVAERKNLPTRMSSLPGGRSARAPSPALEQSSLVTSLDATRLLPPGNPHPGSQDLAAERGDLIALQRRVLSNLDLLHGNQHDHTEDTALKFGSQSSEMEDVALNDDPSASAVSSSSSAEAAIAAGLCNPVLLSAVISSQEFYRAYEVQ